MKFCIKSIGIIILMSFSNIAFSQYDNIEISQEKLEGLFGNKTCALNHKLDESVLWKTTEGKEFLLAQLKSEIQLEQILAISYLAMSKETKYIGKIYPFLYSSNQQIVIATIRGLSSLNTKESILHIEQKLLKVDKNQSEEIAELLLALRNTTLEESIESLKTFALKFKEGDDEKIQQRIEKTIDVISNYYQSIDGQRRYVEQSLFSNDREDFNWAMVKIYQTKDDDYLQQLRILQKQLGTKYTTRKNRILRLRKYLGDKVFTSNEISFLREEERQRELTIERTIEFFSKKGHSHSDDF